MRNWIEMQDDKVLFCNGITCDVHVNKNTVPCDGCLIEHIIEEWNKKQRS